MNRIIALTFILIVLFINSFGQTKSSSITNTFSDSLVKINHRNFHTEKHMNYSEIIMTKNVNYFLHFLNKFDNSKGLVIMPKYSVKIEYLGTQLQKESMIKWNGNFDIKKEPKNLNILQSIKFQMTKKEK